MKIKKHVGKQVRKFRLKKKLSQEKLGFKCDRHRTYISQVERGVINPTIESLKRIADALSIPCWNLIEPL